MATAIADPAAGIAPINVPNKEPLKIDFQSPNILLITFIAADSKGILDWSALHRDNCNGSVGDRQE